MEIELPDGTVLEAPDDADPKVIMRGYRRNLLKQQNPAEYDPASQAYKEKYGPAEYAKGTMYLRGPNGGAKPTTVNTENLPALGSGLLRSYKGLTNLALPDSLTPEWASDENIREMDARDADLPEGGKFLGSLISTAPISAATRAGLGLASKIPGLGAVASPLGQAVAEGAVQGAIYADPDKQGQGAAIGAGLGTALHGLGRLGGRAVRGLVEKSDAAKELEHLAAQHGEDIFVPIAQSADDTKFTNRLAKGFYKEALPIVPGTRGKLMNQADQARNKLREIAVKEGLPTGTKVAGDVGEKPLESMKYIKDEFDRIYDDTVKSYSFNIPSTMRQDLIDGFKKAAGQKTTVPKESLRQVADDIEKIFLKFSDKGKLQTIDGTNLLNAKREISELISQAKGDIKPGYKAADDFIDNIIENDLMQGGSKQNLADLARYKELTPAYRAFVPVRKAAEQAADEEGRFLFRTLARTAKNSPEQRALGQIGAKVLDKSPVTGGLAGKIMAGIGGLGTAGFGAYMGAVPALTAIGVGNALASKPAQKLLLGDTKMQRKLADALRRHAVAKARAGSLARAGVISETRNEDATEQ